jgi:transcriptional regulator with XRE-family HTH domain
MNIAIDKKMLGLWLKDKRNKAGISQREVGTFLGYSSGKQFVSNWERGKSSPPEDVLPKIVSLYNIPSFEFKAVMRGLMEDAFNKNIRKKDGQ